MKKILLILLALCTMLGITTPQAYAERQLAFPGAEGYGRFVTGGRGGEVCYVTRNDDCSDNNLVEGTLRWALNHENGGRPRIILFNTSGTIYLQSKLRFRFPNVSILGQSAPGGGICLTGYNMYINNDNIIIRYVRFRAGDIPNKSMTGLDMENCEGVILDHCSMTWSMEECLTAYDSDSTTVQWCIIGEGLYNSKNSKGARAYATQWGGEHSTMHHTLITNSHSRAPRFNGVRSPSKTKGEHDYQVDSEFANNVVFNWSGAGNQYGGEYDKNTVEAAAWTKDDPGYDRVYLISNYYRPGPATQRNTSGSRYWCAPSTPYGQWYLSGNKFEVNSRWAPQNSTVWSETELNKVNADNYYGAQAGSASRGINLTGSNFTTYTLTEIPYALSGLEYESADNAYQKVVNQAGASLPRYDEVDQRLLDEAAGRIDPQYAGASIPNEKGIIDAPDDIQLSEHDTYVVDGVTYTNFPFLGMREGDRYIVDADCDGMPNAYEDEMGFDKNDPTDGAALAANGYTNVENYLNGIADGALQKSRYETSDYPITPGHDMADEVTYSFTTGRADGEAPKGGTLPFASQYTIPQNTSLYLDGYTLIGWTSQGKTYYIGDVITLVEDMTFAPVFQKNTISIDDRRHDTRWTWDFTLPVAPVLNAEDEGIYVNQNEVEGISIDTYVEYSGLHITLPFRPGAKAFVNDTEVENSVSTDSTLAFITVPADVALRSIAVQFPYEEPTHAQSGSVTIKWPWNTGAYVAAGNFSDEDSALAFASATASYNEDYLSYMSKTDKVIKASWVAFQPAEQISAPDPNYVVEFRVVPATGVSFTPTAISLNAMRFGTDGGKLDIYAVYGDQEVLLDEGLVPERDNTAVTSISHDLSLLNLSEPILTSLNNPEGGLPFALRIYIYSLGNSKQVGFNQVTISGDWSGSSSTEQFSVGVEALPAEGGTVTLTPAGGVYREGTVVTLTAKANSGYNFMGWTDEDEILVSKDPSFEYTVTSDAYFFANFKAYSAYDEIFENCAPYDAAVHSIDELLVALDAAAKRPNLDERYRIFLFDGTYDFGTKALTKVVKNTSLIGESMEGVLLMNNPGTVTKYQDETPVLFIDQNQNDVYMQDLTIRQARDWDTGKSKGQALALRQRAKQAIYKNIRLQGVQDTYYLNKADGTAYFEDCDIAGEVDFIYGDGTMFFEHCTLRPISSGAVITAPNTQTGYKGIVFNKCTIEGAEGYRLGRPWGDSPSSTYLHTTMRSLPNAAGWGSMSSGLVVRFHEFDSRDAEGNPLDLSSRSISACNAAANSDPCVITEEQAAEYTLDKVFPNWYPQSFAQQLSVEVVLSDNQLTWPCPDSALGFAVLKDGQIVAFTGNPYYTLPEGDSAGSYSVRVANLMGGLGAPSNAVTGIQTIHADTPSFRPTPLYNLFGQKVTSDYRGIVVCNQGVVMK